jgi:hypothetical protein
MSANSVMTALISSVLDETISYPSKRITLIENGPNIAPKASSVFCAMRRYGLNGLVDLPRMQHSAKDLSSLEKQMRRYGYN